jgi:hypothetical protein
MKIYMLFMLISAIVGFSYLPGPTAAKPATPARPNSASL